MRRTLGTALAATVLALPLAAAAHPGHGADAVADTLLHYLLEPEHALPLLGVAGLGALLWGRRARHRAD
jgi:hypothetical protein